MLEFRKDIFADERDDNLKEVGQPTQRQDILGHVTGTSAFYDDHRFANLLHLKVLRSPHAHARIRSIDDADGVARPGREADHSGRGRAGQSQYAAESHPIRQG